MREALNVFDVADDINLGSHHSCFTCQQLVLHGNFTSNSFGIFHHDAFVFQALLHFQAFLHGWVVKVGSAVSSDDPVLRFGCLKYSITKPT
ncbi:hypothetical protein D3C85_1071720 [compost metagenome]